MRMPGLLLFHRSFINRIAFEVLGPPAIESGWHDSFQRADPAPVALHDVCAGREACDTFCAVGRIVDLTTMINERKALRDANKRLVFTNGCFDLLHPGHVQYLTQARAMGDVLAIALNSDDSVRKLKGPGRPILNSLERSQVLAALSVVDFVFVFPEDTPRDVVAALLPDVLVKGGDWPLDQIIGREEVEAAGGTVVSLPYVEGCSTSDIIERIRRPPASDE
jgi:D-beta-D-heptose 7-phosphate kinase/D-beta-D-heptose 1-phosphate adenosyltransferase